MPGCAVYTDSAQNDQKIDDRNTFADIPGVQVKDDLSAANDGSNDEMSHISGDWESLGSELQHVDIQPVFDEYDFNGDFVPVKPSDVVMSAADILNRTHCMPGINYQDALAAYDLRESYMQRHLSSLASQAESTELNAKDFNTQSCNVWKTDDASLYPDTSNKVSGGNNVY